MILLIQFSNVQSLKSHIIKNVIYIYNGFEENTT